jgi:hypothetical protein
MFAQRLSPHQTMGARKKLEAMQRRLDRKPDAMTIRRSTVEHVFGTLKHWMGSAHFLTRTLGRVSMEMSLQVLADNRKRVMNILGVAGAMKAMKMTLAMSVAPRIFLGTVPVVFYLVGTDFTLSGTRHLGWMVNRFGMQGGRTRAAVLRAFDKTPTHARPFEWALSRFVCPGTRLT